MKYENLRRERYRYIYIYISIVLPRAVVNRFPQTNELFDERFFTVDNLNLSDEIVECLRREIIKNTFDDSR